jgi:NAD(P) transhydrogenase subunit alpha
VQIGIPRERADGERRVAAVPSVVDTYVGWGLDVVVEAGAGDSAGFPDTEFEASGARIGSLEAAAGSDIVLRVGPPSPDEIRAMRAGAVIVGFLDPFVSVQVVRALIDANVTGVAVEAVPRITIAQGMDALSSQANLAGYAAVLTCAHTSPKLVPMMVTAAGTIRPSKTLVLGVGVAGLQAIATARRLGAIVFAYDVRPETKEQVESLGARFVEAPTTEADEGGYATEVDADIQARQHEVLAPYVADADMIVTTAQIPGRPAPLLITAEMVADMRPGSVIVDMAAATGGNVAGTQPDAIVHAGGVEIHGPTNLASVVAFDASQMYARNLVAMLERMRGEEGTIGIDLEDEIIGEATVVSEGRALHPRTAALLGEASPA